MLAFLAKKTPSLPVDKLLVWKLILWSSPIWAVLVAILANYKINRIEKSTATENARKSALSGEIRPPKEEPSAKHKKPSRIEPQKRREVQKADSLPGKRPGKIQTPKKVDSSEKQKSKNFQDMTPEEKQIFLAEMEEEKAKIIQANKEWLIKAGYSQAYVNSLTPDFWNTFSSGGVSYTRNEDGTLTLRERHGSIPHLPGRIKVLMGGNDFFFDLDKLRQGAVIEPLRTFGGSDYNLTLRLENNKIYISGVFRSYDGKLVAEMKDNEWEINPTNYFRRNYDDHGLEVIDSDGITKFQIEFTNSNTVQIGGIFVDKTKVTWLSSIMAAFIVYPGKIDVDHMIKNADRVPNIFLYPSDKYLGKRVGK